MNPAYVRERMRLRVVARLDAPNMMSDGARLASLLIEHGVGVTNRAYRRPKAHSD